jgi:hypothetical protein
MMRMNRTSSNLVHISTPPASDEEFGSWLELANALNFLSENLRENDFVVYAGLAHTFIHAIPVPATLLHPPDVEDLMAWNCNASSSWGISHFYSDPPEIIISPPLHDTGSKTLDQGEQLVFARYFEGRSGKKNYIEVLQTFVQIFDLHFLHERNAYCRLDKHGDIEDVISIFNIPAKGEGYDGTIVTFNRAVLDEYMSIANLGIVRTFDFTRWRPTQFAGWSHTQDEKQIVEEDLIYRLVVEPGHASYARGCQIIMPQVSKETVVKRLGTYDREEQQYASFIAHDWKHDIVTEISCAPGATANYFTQSDLPFEMSSVFFRPEALAKYKADTEKYRFNDRSISCRGAWHLQTFDINEEGQVHTYLVYLRTLPYEEQLHWKAYNEKPKGPISERSFKTDFLGEWDLEYDPLNSLKEKLRELNRKQVPWWTLRSKNLMDNVHYPATSSPDEWANEILHADQLVVEGFEERWLRKKVEDLGRTPDSQFKGLKLVAECLIGLGSEEERAMNTIKPLQTLHFLRSKVKGHASGEEALSIKQGVLSTHGSFRNHFRQLLSECDNSMEEIIQVLS